VVRSLPCGLLSQPDTWCSGRAFAWWAFRPRLETPCITLFFVVHVSKEKLNTKKINKLSDSSMESSKLLPLEGPSSILAFAISFFPIYLCNRNLKSEKN